MKMHRRNVFYKTQNYDLFISPKSLTLNSVKQDLGGFQILDLILPELKSHVIPYKFKSSHWLRANLVKDFFTNEFSTNEST